MSDSPFIGQKLRSRVPFSMKGITFPAGTKVRVISIEGRGHTLIRGRPLAITIGCRSYERKLYVNHWSELLDQWLIPVSPLELLAEAAE